MNLFMYLISIYTRWYKNEDLIEKPEKLIKKIMPLKNSHNQLCFKENIQSNYYKANNQLLKTKCLYPPSSANPHLKLYQIMFQNIP